MLRGIGLREHQNRVSRKRGVSRVPLHRITPKWLDVVMKKIPLTVRLDEDVHAALAVEAKASNRSSSAQIGFVIRADLEAKGRLAPMKTQRKRKTP